MLINGKVIEVLIDVQVPKKGGGFYPGCMLTYRDHEGKACEQAFHENAFKFKAHLKEALGMLHSGDTFRMEKEKQGDFWNVMSINKTDGTEQAIPAVTPQGTVTAGPQASTSRPATKVTGSNYETPEERAKKQVYIVRQSSITAALNYHGLVKTKDVTSADIISTAKEFEAFVFSIPEEDPVESIIAMEDDIPQ